MTYLQVMLEFEGLVAFCAFELSQNGALVVADHVTLEAVDVRKRLVAYFAGLQMRLKKFKTCIHSIL